MPGGQYDSSKTRVAPVLDQLKARGGDWVRDLLTLPKFGSGERPSSSVDVAFVEGHWGAKERGLAPPVALLSWLIRNLSTPVGNTTVDENRARLLQGDSATIETALNLLRSAGTERRWHAFEGLTYPDATIETPDALIVIEGKRTERGPTTHTTWMPGRHQMWRHMDAAWEIRGRRAVFGFFLVDGLPPEPIEVPSVWELASQATLAATGLDGSFPHRSDRERQGIAQGFLGVATWQCVCAKFGLDFNTLPDTVDV